jgi:hypothetical protein
MKGPFILIFDLTLDGCASGGRTSIPDNGIHIELKSEEALAEAVTILLYLKFATSIQLDRPKRYNRLEIWTCSRTMHPAMCLRLRGSSRLISCPLIHSMVSLDIRS